MLHKMWFIIWYRIIQDAALIPIPFNFYVRGKMVLERPFSFRKSNWLEISVLVVCLKVFFLLGVKATCLAY